VAAKPYLVTSQPDGSVHVWDPELPGRAPFQVQLLLAASLFIAGRQIRHRDTGSETRFERSHDGRLEAVFEESAYKEVMPHPQASEPVWAARRGADVLLFKLERGRT
jgi:hypothetical protein